jgi:hypothetical protein
LQERRKTQERRKANLSTFSVNWCVPETRTGMCQLPESNTYRNNARVSRASFSEIIY